MENRPTDQVYVLAVGPEDDPCIFYVGVTVQPHRRFCWHMAALERGVDHAVYEWLRGDPRRDTVRMIIVDPDGEHSEEWWRQKLLSIGHPLANVYAGNQSNRKIRGKTSPIQKLFREINKANEHLIGSSNPINQSITSEQCQA